MPDKITSVETGPVVVAAVATIVLDVSIDEVAEVLVQVVPIDAGDQ